MEVFLVLQYRDSHGDFEVQGVFSTREKAEAACVNDRYSVSPLTVDQAFPDERGPELDGYFPLAGKAKA